MNSLQKSQKVIISIFIIILLITCLFYFLFHYSFKSSSININLELIGDVEISADAINFTKKINQDKLKNAKTNYKTARNQLPNVLSRVSSSGIVQNGQLDLYYEQLTKEKNAYFISSFKQNDTNCLGDDCQDAYYITYDLFFKASEPTNIGLANSSYVKSSAKNQLQNAARIAFIVEGTSNSSDKSIAQNLNGGINAIIWQPNCDTHSEASLQYAKEHSLSLNDDELSYRAIAKPFTSLNLNDIAASSSFSYVEPDLNTPQVIPESQRLFTIQSGITKVKIYMWLESRDIDMMLEEEGTNLDFLIKFVVME